MTFQEAIAAFKNSPHLQSTVKNKDDLKNILKQLMNREKILEERDSIYFNALPANTKAEDATMGIGETVGQTVFNAAATLADTPRQLAGLVSMIPHAPGRGAAGMAEDFTKTPFAETTKSMYEGSKNKMLTDAPNPVTGALLQTAAEFGPDFGPLVYAGYKGVKSLGKGKALVDAGKAAVDAARAAEDAVVSPTTNPMSDLVRNLEADKQAAAAKRAAIQDADEARVAAATQAYEDRIFIDDPEAWQNRIDAAHGDALDIDKLYEMERRSSEVIDPGFDRRLAADRAEIAAEEGKFQWDTDEFNRIPPKNPPQPVGPLPPGERRQYWGKKGPNLNDPNPVTIDLGQTVDPKIFDSEIEKASSGAVRAASDTLRVSEILEVDKTSERLVDTMLGVGEHPETVPEELIEQYRKQEAYRSAYSKIQDSIERAIASDVPPDAPTTVENVVKAKKVKGKAKKAAESALGTPSTPSEPIVPEMTTVVRTANDAFARLTEAAKAVASMKKQQLTRTFARLQKNGRIAADVDMATILRQSDQSIYANLDDQIGMLRKLTNGKSDDEAIRIVDEFVNSNYIKKYKLEEQALNLAIPPKSNSGEVVAAASEWLQFKNIADKPIVSMTNDELLALRNRALLHDAPPAVFDAIKHEAARRIDDSIKSITANTPKPMVNGKAISPDITISGPKIAEKAEEATRRIEAEIATGNSRITDTEPDTLSAHWRGFKSWFKTQFSSYNQLTENEVFGGMLGKGIISYEHITQLLTDAAARAGFRSRLELLTRESKAAGAEVERITQVGMHDIKNLVRQYAKKNGKKANDVYKTIYDGYVKGKEFWMQEADPLLAQAYQRADSTVKQLSEFVKSNQFDPEIIEKINDNAGKYLFRQYSAFRDPKAVFRSIDKDNAAYKKLFSDLKTENLDKLKMDVYAQHADTIRGSLPAGATDAEVASALDQIVDNRVHAMIESQVKSFLRTPGSKVIAKSAVGKAGQTYLKNRQLNNELLREVLGEEKHITQSLYSLSQDIAHDVHAFTLRKGLYDLMLENGLISNKPVPGLSKALNRSTMLPFEEGAEGLAQAADGVVWTHPNVISVLNGIDQSISGATHVVSKAISMAKLFLISRPSTFVANVLGTVPNIFAASGIVRNTLGMKSTFKDLVLATQISKEVAFPGTSGLSPEKLKAGLSRFGFKGIEDVRAAADEVAKYGLDVGGEFFAEGTEGIKAAMTYSTESIGAAKAKSAVAKGARAGLEIYRSPDVVTKVFSYRSILNEMKWKMGVDFITEDMRKAAVKMTLDMTQDPRSTPAAIRNLSRGWLGIPFAGFQGFHYQMGKSLYNSFRYGLKDLATASTLMSAGKSAEGARYAAAGMDRLAGSVVASYGIYKFIETELDVAKEVKEGFQHFLRPSDRTQNVYVRKVETGKDGHKYVSLLYPESTDVYASTMRVVKALTDGATSGDPLKAMAGVTQELKDIMFQPSFMLNALLNVGNMQIDEYFPGDGSLAKLRYLEGDKPKLSGKGIVAATGRMMPGVVSQVAKSYSNKKEMKLADERLKELGPERPSNKDAYMEAARQYEKAKSKYATTGGNAMLLHGGIRGQREDYTILTGARYREEWEKATWLPDARREWKDAKSLDAKRQVISKYETQWNKMYGAMLDHTNYAKNYVGFTDKELIKAITFDGKYNYLSQTLRNSIVRGRKISFRNYLFSVGE